MNILILGDVAGPAGVKAVKGKLPGIINEKKIDFVVLNGENAADSGRGIIKENVNLFLESGINVITSGNHIWEHKETSALIAEEERLLRPENLLSGSPGSGCNIFDLKNKKKIAVINLMGNVFMKKWEDVFEETAHCFIVHDIFNAI